VMTLDPPTNVIPLAFQFVVPVAVPLPPRSLAHVTCVTPTASLAVPPTVSGVVPVVKVVPVVGVAIETAGAVVSGALKVTVRMAVAKLPAASRAVTVSVFEPPSSVMLATLQLVVPLAVPLPPRLFDHVTCVTLVLSLAEPPRPIVADVVVKVVLVVGVLIATVGF